MTQNRTSPAIRPAGQKAKPDLLTAEKLAGPKSAQIDLIDRPVFSLFTETTVTGEFQPHVHTKAQLMYVIDGVLTVEADGGIWTVPPKCAFWIPGGIVHKGRVVGHINIGNLYLDPSLTTDMHQKCGILFVQPFLRELIMRFDNTLPTNATREANLIAVLRDELIAAPLEPIHLPMPTDRRLRRLTETMLAQPDLRFTISEWGARVGASNRTLTRLFQRETGMSFTRWRQQLHIGIALQRLAAGDSVTTIAGDLGYESLSAFISMFRRMLGSSPTHYFADRQELTQPDETNKNTGDTATPTGEDTPPSDAEISADIVILKRSPHIKS
ncbi:AraC family transcriptional regulator [Thalassospira marina]|uniref:AraC family transcriptional regulator n=1 Tax=Thalassospira marina TaxID=2048283 RepID=A0A2N3KTL4_9PROT|nr:helix-turn-helix transcriptional regulator [Thalassospira marina]PKR53850.1 AraC family transcriptional regulator [Thalassospira marina]